MATGTISEILDNPQPQAANLYRVGIYVHTKKAIFDNGLLFMEKGFLHPLTFAAEWIVFK